MTLETKDEVYEHTKYICDRLTGSKILDILTYKIDGVHDYIITKLELPDGNIEYASSFSIRAVSEKQMILESYWNLGDYTKNTEFLNFQIWANNTNNLFRLVNGVFDLVNSHSTIEEFNIGTPPEVFVVEGSIDDGILQLDIINKSGVKYLEAVGNYSLSETMEQETMMKTLSLSGANREKVTLDVGNVYYLGLGLYHPEIVVEDEVFLANGAWGYSIDLPFYNTIDSYEILPSEISETNDNYHLPRALEASGNVKEYITFYRSFDPRLSKRDLDAFQSISFTANGNATLEISVLKEGISSWQQQGKSIIELTVEENNYVLGKAFFKDVFDGSKTWEDAYMLVVNVLGDKEEVTPFDISLSNFEFGNKRSDGAFVISSDKNIIAPGILQHTASFTDGTDLGDVEMTADFTPVILPLLITNIGSADIVVDDIELLDASGAFDLVNFEPGVINGEDKMEVELKYNPKGEIVNSDIQLVFHLASKNEFHSIPIQVTAQSLCAIEDHISTSDIENKTIRELKAKHVITSDASLNSDQRLSFIANEEINLKGGFTVMSGGQLELTIEDRCQTSN